MKDEMEKEPEVETNILAETTNYLAWQSEEPDGEIVHHLELGIVTLHFFREEWEELLSLVRSL